MSDDFRHRYGPWGVVAGAAVGLGAEWARQLAGRGLDVVLIDRDAAPVRADGAGDPRRLRPPNAHARARPGACRRRRRGARRHRRARARARRLQRRDRYRLAVPLALARQHPGHARRELSRADARGACARPGAGGARARRHRPHVVHVRQLRLVAAHGVRGRQGVRPGVRRRAVGRDARARRGRARGAAGLDAHAGLAVFAAAGAAGARART